MSFAAPWFILGALGAAVPVLIHLYGQRRARRVLFPSLMLLRRAERERSSLVRLRQLWLMLLRALIILCLALALARPTLHGLRVPWMAGSPVVLLLDDSLSTQARGPARTSFAAACEAVADLLTALPPGQPVALAPLSRPAEGLTATTPTTLRTALEGLRPTYAAVDLPAALERLWRTPPEAGWREARWVLLTDCQATAWRGEARPPAWLRDLLVVDCGAEGPNLAVTSLEVLDAPALVGRPLRLRVEISGQPAATLPPAVPVQVTINQGALPRADCPLTAGHGEVLCEWTPSTPGPLQIKATIPRDRLEADNTAYLAVEVREHLRVTLLGSEAATRRARLALAPTPRAPVKTQTTATPSADLLAAQDAAILVDAAATAQRDLGSFVAAGGGLLVFAAAQPKATLAYLSGSEQLLLGKLVSPAAPVRIGSFDSFHPPLQAFANAAAGDLREPEFRRYRELSVPANSPWRVLARFTDQTPALLAGEIGRGRIVLVNFAPDAATTDLTSLPVFVPLLHRLVGYVARGPRPELTNFLVGQTVDAQALRGAAVAATDPASSSSTPWLDHPGFHDLRWRDASGQQGVTRLAANVDPLETDLRPLAPAELQTRLRPLRVHVRRPETAAEALPATGLALATPLWWLGLLLLVTELFLLRRTGARETARLTP